MLACVCAALTATVAVEGVALVTDQHAIHNLNVRASSVPTRGPQGPPGPAGPPGAQGPIGPQGLRGEPGLNGTSSDIDLTPYARRQDVAQICEALVPAIEQLQEKLARATGAIYFSSPQMEDACDGA